VSSWFQKKLVLVGLTGPVVFRKLEPPTDHFCEQPGLHMSQQKAVPFFQSCLFRHQSNHHHHHHPLILAPLPVLLYPFWSRETRTTWSMQHAEAA